MKKQNRDLDPFHKALKMILSELGKAEEKFPTFPDDLIHAVGIMTEEAGEAMREAIDWEYPKEQNAPAEVLDRLAMETAQTGAMAIRTLVKVLEFWDRQTVSHETRGE